MTRRTVTVTVGWVALAGVVLAVLAVSAPFALWWWHDDPAPCSTHQPAPALERTGWPTVTRGGVVVQPEDLDRPS